MKSRQLGRSGLEVSTLGFGCLSSPMAAGLSSSGTRRRLARRGFAMQADQERQTMDRVNEWPRVAPVKR